MKYYDKDKNYDKYYKRIEAMYYKGFSIDEIVNNIRGMDRIDIINIIQLVEARKNLRRAQQGLFFFFCELYKWFYERLA